MKLCFLSKGKNTTLLWVLDESDDTVFFISDQYQSLRLVIIGLFSKLQKCLLTNASF